MIRGIGLGIVGAGLARGVQQGLDAREALDRQNARDAMVNDEYQRRKAEEEGQSLSVLDRANAFAGDDLSGLGQHLPTALNFLPAPGGQPRTDGSLPTVGRDVPPELLAGPAAPGAPAPAPAAAGDQSKKGIGLAVPGGVTVKASAKAARSGLGLAGMGLSTGRMTGDDTEGGLEQHVSLAQGAYTGLQGLQSQIKQVIGGRDLATLDGPTRTRLAAQIKPLLEEAQNQQRLLADTVGTARTLKDSAFGRHAFNLLMTTGDTDAVADFMAANGAPQGEVAKMRLTKFDSEHGKIITPNGTVLDPAAFGIAKDMISLTPSEQARFLLQSGQFQERLSAQRFAEQLRANSRVQAVLARGSSTGAKDTPMARYLSAVDRLATMERNGQAGAKEYEDLLHYRDLIAQALPVSTPAGYEAKRDTSAGQEDQFTLDLRRAQQAEKDAWDAKARATASMDRPATAAAETALKEAVARRKKAEETLKGHRQGRGIAPAPNAPAATTPPPPQATAFSID